MPDELITIGNFWNAVEANIAKNHLEAEGIKAYIADENVVSMHWGLSAALTGIKLQIRSSDLERAEEILSQLEEEEVDEEALEQASLNAAPEEEEEAAVPSLSTETAAAPSPTNVREERAYIAAVLAVVGLVIVPVQLWVAWLLARILFSKMPMRKGAYLASLFAGFINLLFWFIVARMVIALNDMYS